MPTLEAMADGRPRYEVNEAGCWIWQGAKTPKGYGTIWWRGKHRRAHRAFYEEFVGAIPEDRQLHHDCRERACVNPEHLRLVTPRENAMLDDTPARRNARKTHCHLGHELTEGNIYWTKDGGRHCRQCALRRAREQKQRRKAAAFQLSKLEGAG